MSRHLEATIAEAAATNLNVAATIEWLADLILEAPPFCKAQPNIDALLPAFADEYSTFLLADAPTAGVMRGLMDGAIDQLHHLPAGVLMMVPCEAIDCRTVLRQSDFDCKYLLGSKSLAPADLAFQFTSEIVERCACVFGP